ncbi:MAG: hypothetical protein KAU23_05635 [Anaerolineales bacterium]|nr:hypothetical protein [Anaerolineales bacterium]
MTETNQQELKTSKTSFPSILLRLLLAALAGTIIGAVVYFTAIGGWIPYLDQRIFHPIDKNRAVIMDVQATQLSLEVQIRRQQDINLSNQATLDIIEYEIQQLNDEVQSIQSAVDTNTLFILRYTQDLATLEAKLSHTNMNLDALATAQFNSSSINNDLDLLRILELLSRANQYLLHSNFGLAEETLMTAKLDLLNLQESLPGFQQEVISNMLNLVDQVIVDLPAKPALAAEKLELAWQIGINGLPQLQGEGNTSTMTSTPYIQATSLTSTPTP